MNKNSEALLTAKPFELMLKLSVPAIIGMVVVGLYPLMDGIFAGQILGEKAMTAVGIAVPFTYLNTGIATLIGIGSASVLSRALGEKNQRTIDQVMGNLIFWVLVMSSVIMAAGLLFCRNLLSLMGAGGEILELSVRYLRVVLTGSIFVNFAQSANMVMRGEGAMKRAMIIMGMGALINIVLDPILMTRMGSRGIEGAAAATVAAQVIQAVVTFCYFRRKSDVIRIGKIRAEKDICRDVFGVGVSAMLMQVLTIIQQSFLYGQAFRFGGDGAAAVMSAALRFQAFSFIPLWGMSQGLQPAIGTNFGARQYDRVRVIFRTFVLSSLALAAVFWIPAELFAERILGLFGLSGQTLLLGVPAFRVMYSIFILYGVLIMTLTFFQAIGDGKTAGVLVMLRQIVLFIPVILLLPAVFGVGGIWFVAPLVDGAVIALGLVRYAQRARRMQAGAQGRAAAQMAGDRQS